MNRSGLEILYLADRAARWLDFMSGSIDIPPNLQKRIGMTSLGFPGLSSQSISGVFWPFSARKPRNGLE